MRASIANNDVRPLKNCTCGVPMERKPHKTAKIHSVNRQANREPKGPDMKDHAHYLKTEQNPLMGSFKTGGLLSSMTVAQMTYGKI